MDSIELALAMLLAVIVSGYLVRALPITLPLPIVQIALGWLVSSVLHHGVELKPSVFFLLFLPPLLFLDGWRIPKDGLFRDKGTILQLALGLVMFTVVGAGYFIYWLIPAMPLAVAFALAAIVSPTDPVAVSSIASRVPIPKRLMHILEGESLLNDASGLVCFQFAVAAVLTGSFSLKSASLTFLWVALIGLASGILFTLAIAFVQQRLTRRFGEEGGSTILVNLLTPFGAYLIAEQLDASGILAAVAAGITMSYVDLTSRSMATTRIERTAVWNTIQFTLNGVMFVLLGEQLPSILKSAMSSSAIRETGHQSPWWLLFYALALTAGLVVLRFAWVWIALQFRMWRQRQSGVHTQKPGWRLVLATSLAGVRGAITLAGILTLPFLMPDGGAFPARNLTIFLAASVIVLSLIIASIGLPILLKDLQLPQESTERKREDRARRAAAIAAIEAIQKLQEELLQQGGTGEANVHADAASRALAVYQRRIHTDEASDTDAQQLRKADAVERELRLAGLRAEREVLLRLARKRLISDATSRRLVREIDLIEALYT